MTCVSVASFDELHDAISQAVGDKQTLTVQAEGTKASYGNIIKTDATLDLSAMSGVIDYEPEELIITAHAATQLQEIEALLASKGQVLSFEPPHISHLYQTKSEGTIGGILATNLSGPRRLSAGAARDYLLGFQAVSGRANIFRSGSKVVKNVTGYDLSKLMCGSCGTLAVMDEVTLKVLPAAQTSLSLLVSCSDLAKAGAAARAALQTAYEPSATAILPARLTSYSAACDMAVIRLEGVRVSVEDRAHHLQESLSSFGKVERLDGDASLKLWRQIADCQLLPSQSQQIWRISLAPTSGPHYLSHLKDELECQGYFDWAGGLLWLACDEDEAHIKIRHLLAKCGGGHATLMRGSDELRSSISVFQPQDAPLAALNKRIIEAFDPYNILNPGRI